MGEKFPKSYIALEQILHQVCDAPVPLLMLTPSQTQVRMKIPIVSLTHLKTIGHMVGHHDPAQTVRAAGLLHEMGSIIYFKNLRFVLSSVSFFLLIYQEPGLSQMVILDPTWLTKMMATLFTTKHACTDLQNTSFVRFSWHRGEERHYSAQCISSNLA